MENEEKIELRKLFRRIDHYLVSGIQSENGLRNFNLLDYYRMVKEITGSCKINLLWCLHVGIVGPAAYERISRFVSTQEGYSVNSVDINNLLQIKFIRGDWTMSQEEKLNIIDQLKNEELPINNVTYTLAVNNYIMTTIIKNDNPQNNDKKRVKLK